MQLVQDRRLEVALAQLVRLGQVEEVEHVRVLDHIDRPLERLPPRGEVGYCGVCDASPGG